jgi:hypothetical protein
MSDHDARPQPSETVRTDAGGWISGPSLDTQPVPADQIEAGDKLLYAGMQVTVTSVRPSRFWHGTELTEGIAIDWSVGNRLGRIFRRASEVLDRLA